MSLVAIAAALRAQCNTNPQQRAWRTLSSGLGIEARPDGTWWLWRVGVEPSDLEVKTFARDAKVTGGYTLDTKPHQGKVFRRLRPLSEPIGSSTYVVCPSCRARSLVSDGVNEFCPACEHGKPVDTPLGLEVTSHESQVSSTDTPPATDADPREMVIDWERLESEMDLRYDQRPGKPLERVRGCVHGQLYHFEAYGVLWTVKLEVVKDDADHAHTLAAWACLEAAEGPHGGMMQGSLEAFETWFKAHGQLSPLEPPVRWRRG